MITEKSLSPLKKAKKKKIKFVVLMCGPRGRTFSFTVPVSGDPTIVVYEKASRIFEKIMDEDDGVIALSDLDGFLAFIEATDFKPVEESLVDWN